MGTAVLNLPVRHVADTPHLSVSSGLMALLFFSSLPPRFSPALIAAGFAFIAGFLLLLRREDRPAEPEKRPE